MPHLNRQTTREGEKGIERETGKGWGGGTGKPRLPDQFVYVRHFNEDNNSSHRKVVFKIFTYVEGLEDSFTT